MKEQSTKEAFMRDFIKAQKEMRPAAMEGANPRFSTKYSTITSVLNACMEALYSNNLAMTQPVEHKEIGMVVTTRITHVSGEFIETSLPLIMPKQDMQTLGAAITYGRRYGLITLLGIPCEDDDANSVTEYNPPKKKNKPLKISERKNTNNNSKQNLKDDVQDKNWEPDRKWFCAAVVRFGGYDNVSRWTVEKGWGKPSTWTNEQRSNFIIDLENGVINVETK